MALKNPKYEARLRISKNFKINLIMPQFLRKNIKIENEATLRFSIFKFLKISFCVI